MTFSEEETLTTRLPSWTGGESLMGENLHFNMMIFNELQSRHYKRSEGSSFLSFHSQLNNFN